MDEIEPQWLQWARELQALAQTGLTFTRDPYDRERYERLRALAAEMFHSHSGEPVERIAALFAEQSGYATPKVDVRAAVFDGAGRILMVRETVRSAATSPVRGGVRCFARLQREKRRHGAPSSRPNAAGPTPQPRLVVHTNEAPRPALGSC